MTITAPDGSYTIGGGSDNWGQTVTEDNFKALFSPPTPTPGNLMQDLRAALSLLPKETLDQFAPWMGLTDVFSGIQDAIDQIMDSFGTKPLTKVIQDVQDAIDGLVNGLAGWTETGYTPAQLKVVAKDVYETMSGIKTTVEALLAAGGYGGNAAVIDFSTMADASSLGADWDQWHYGSGDVVLGISGGRAKMIGSTANNRMGFGRYTALKTKSSYQKVGMVFSTKPSKGLFGGSQSMNRIAGRVADDNNSSVCLDLRASSFTLGCIVDGTWTTFSNNPDPFDFKAGVAYWLECGTTGGVRIFRVWENNRILLTYTDSAAVSREAVSAGVDDYKGVAMLQQAYGDSFRPAEAVSLAFYDNQPGDLLGSGWRISRTSTGNEDQSSGDNTFPASYFDTVDYATSDLVIDMTNNKVTVDATGWYAINVCQFADNTIVGSGSVAASLLVNGTVAQQATPVPQSGTNHGFSGAFVQYLHDGDNVKPGYWSSWSPVDQLSGEATGTKTYWSGVYLGTAKKIPSLGTS